MTTPAWLTPAQAGELLQVNERTVRRWLNEGTLRGSLLGRIWRVSPAAIDEFMKAHEGKTEGDQAQGGADE